MAQAGITDRSYYEGIPIDVSMMGVNDLIASGAMPVTLNDEVAAGDSEWFTDARRSKDIADGFYEACKVAGMALVGGESPSYKYLVRAESPVRSAPIMSVAVTGIHAPSHRLFHTDMIRADDVIIGLPSTGLHANGVSLVIKRALVLQDSFLTKLPNGNTLGDEALIPTACYVPEVKALLEAGIELHAFQPGTGGGVGKVAFNPNPFTYRIHTWPEVPPLFQYMREIGVSIKDCLTTFKWGVGYYVFVPKKHAQRALAVLHNIGSGALEVGRVEKGDRCTIFGPEKGLVLPPPTE